jgi:Mrp family chromosome partitioning ATPase
LRFGHSSAKVVKRAVELLRDRRANVIGVICNGLSQAYAEYYQYRCSEYYHGRI